jgi:hypothetical protein
MTVRIRKVSPLLAVELQKQFPPPRPPKQKVTLDGKEVWEENPVDPDHLAALQDYNNEQERRLRKLMLKRGVEVEIDKEEVAELREFWKTEYNKELEGDDLEVYVSYIVIGSDGDLEDLMNAILKRSQPTAEDINAATQTFKS